MKTSKTVEVDIDGQVFSVTIEASFYMESNYGADADGNRGIEAWFMDDYILTDIQGGNVTESIRSAIEDEISNMIDDIDFPCN
jgi:hypothetical protein